MKKRFFAAFLCLLILLGVGMGSVSAQMNTDTVGEAQGFLDGILAFRTGGVDPASVQAWINGELTETAGVSAEWYILALSQSGEYDFSSYERSLLSYLSEHTVASASSQLKYALCLSAVGSTDSYISTALNDAIGKQGIMSLIYGLHLLNNGYVSTAYTAGELRQMLLSLQCEDGGWSLTGKTGNVDVSAMAVQVLAISYDVDNAVRQAIDRALTFLSETQLPSGDYESYGVSNPESTAQVLVALSSLGIDCRTDVRFVKDGKTLLDGIARYRLSDGSFCHALGGAFNLNATVQVFYAMVAYLRMAEGRTPLYMLDRCQPSEVATAPETSPVDSESESASSENATDGEAEKSKIGSYKPWATLIILVLGGVACLILYLTKKRNVRNFIAVLIATALAITFVWVTDFQRSEDYYGTSDAVKENAIGTVSVTIRCDTVVGMSDSEYIPEDGILLDVTEFAIEQGDTVYDILIEAARKYHIQVENNGSAELAYIVGIGYLYEKQFGDLSGWIYHVNGEAASVGCGDYVLSDGDVIEWHYTCDLGNDVK